MADFSLNPRLRQLVDVLVSAPRIGVGDKLPISIRKPYEHVQSVIIFPEDGYNFFTSTEVSRIQQLVEIFDCSVIIRVYGDVPVIDIAAYF